jgi:hypothetical protein
MSKPDENLAAQLQALAEECERQKILFIEKQPVETATGHYIITVNRVIEPVKEN